MKVLNFTILFFVLTTSAFASQQKKTVKLRLQGPTGYLDDATIYFDQGVAGLYNYQEDAQKVYSGVAGVPAIFSLTTDNVQCSINGFGTLSNTEIVPLGYKVDTSGMYKLTATLLDNFDPTSIIVLEDKQKGVMIDLRANFYQTQMTDSDAIAGRFFLHISYAARYSSINAGCANNDGSIAIVTDPSVTWPYCNLYNSIGVLIAVDSNITGSANFDSLPSGDYTTVFVKNQYTATNSYHLDGNYVTATIGVPVDTIFTNEAVIFNAIATNATVYAWDLGDGTWINGVAHPEQVYLVPGTYTVDLKCSNDKGCSAEAQASVLVLQGVVATGINDEVKQDMLVYAQGRSVVVKMNDVANSNASLKVFNLIGQPIYTTTVSAQTETISFNEQPAGYYLVSLLNAGKTITKRVFIP